ncbi:MAG: hypothetical protein COY40_04295 [Alphaproteobacteria bacterium CG_4_10_14_0_8_um_filter_53_9]|nr:MAG: hypothetical protein COY40_04295 [Alphaproteobacteria bacterium CG_4_10_14_0_8_um_filter_53_9]
MHWLTWVFTGIFFGVSYRLGYKLISNQFPPILSAAIVTLVASLTCFVIYFIQTNMHSTIVTPPLKTLWPLLLVGLILAGLEVSIIMLYHAGGPLSIAQSMASSAVGIIVFIIGITFFKESLNTGQLIGFVLGLSGITLLTYYSYAK